MGDILLDWILTLFLIMLSIIVALVVDIVVKEIWDDWKDAHDKGGLQSHPSDDDQKQNEKKWREF